MLMSPLNTIYIKFPVMLTLFWCCVHRSQTYTFTNLRQSFLQQEQWNAETKAALKLKFKTYSANGLILYSDNSKSTGHKEDFITLKLNYGKLQFTVQMGSEDYKSRKFEYLGKNLDDSKWHTIEIQRLGNATKLILDGNNDVVLNHADSPYETLELNSGMFFGGISRQLASKLIDQTIKAMPRFVGCIENILYKSGTSTFEPADTSPNAIANSPEDLLPKNVIAAVAVEEGCKNACASFQCPHGGTCLNYFSKARCDCIGTGYDGDKCEKEAASLQFESTGYVAVSLAGPRRSTAANQITLRFKTKKPDGVMLAGWNGNDHLMLEMYQTKLRFSMDLGGGAHEFEVEHKFDDGRWHLVEIKRQERDIYLMVDRKFSINDSTDGVFSKFDLQKDFLYAGGHPQVQTLGKINSRSKVNFNGCLQQLFYNGLDIVYKVISSRSRGKRFRKFGNVKEGCSVTKSKPKKNRNIVLNISKTGPGLGNPGSIGDGNTPTVTTDKDKPRQRAQKNGSSLSKSSTIWIAVGVFAGFIALIITIALIVHSIKNRHSGVFLSATYKENNVQSKYLLKPSKNVFPPSRKHNFHIQPHLV